MAPEPENKGGGGDNKGGGQPQGGGGGGQQQKKKPFANEAKILEAVMTSINGLLNAAAFTLVFGLVGFNDLTVQIGDNIYRVMDMFNLAPEIWGSVVGMWLLNYAICLIIGMASQWVLLFLKITLGIEYLPLIIRLNNIDIGINVLGFYVILVEWLGINAGLRDAIHALIAALDLRAFMTIFVMVALALGFNSLAEMTTRNTRK